MRVFEITVPRNIFLSNLDEVTGDWRKLQNKEFPERYCRPTFIWDKKLSSRMICWGHVSRWGRVELHTGFRWGNVREKWPLLRHRRRCDDNIEMDV
jgi:hypothetical protein